MRFRAPTTRSLLAAPIVFAAGAAHGQVAISSHPTKSIVCSAGVCSPTAAKANLNVSDLEGLLASGNVTVTTTGAGVQANDIDANAALQWSSAGQLTLDAARSLDIAKAVSIKGAGGIDLVTDDGGSGGTLTFGPKGRVRFSNLSSSAVVNGVSYLLVASIGQLVAAVAANPAGAYALANNYNARHDGTYAKAPVATTLTGAFEGFGNTISNLSILDSTADDSVGLFAEIGLDSDVTGPSVADLRLTKVSINVSGTDNVGALAGVSYNSIVSNITVSGSVSGTNSGYIGGLMGIAENTGFAYPYGSISGAAISASVSVSGTATGYAGGIVAVLGGNNALLQNSHATGSVSANQSTSAAGGLVSGLVGSTIDNCYATGAVTGAFAGGLVGGTGTGSVIENSFATGAISITNTLQEGGQAGGLSGSTFDTTISNSYATGSVTGVELTDVGGLVGDDYNGVYQYAYATGALATGSSGVVGGIIGRESGPGDAATDVYWDTETTGAPLAIGANGNSSGMTGLTTAQFQSGLPAGFSTSIWNESSGINSGFPYLLANPPP